MKAQRLIAFTGFAVAALSSGQVAAQPVNEWMTDCAIDQAAEKQKWYDDLTVITDRIARMPLARGEVIEPEGVDLVPRLRVSWDRWEYPLDGLALRQHVLDAAAQALPSAYVNAHFDYRSRAIRGIETQPPRAEQVIVRITGNIGSEPLAEGLGQLYVARAFSPEAKARATSTPSPFGDGKSAPRIIDALARWIPPSPPSKRWSDVS